MDYGTEEKAAAYSRYAAAALGHPVRQHVTLQFFGDVTEKRVVDFGCGDGSFLKLCLAQGASFCLGLDVSDAMVKSGGGIGISSKAQDRRLIFEVQDSFKPSVSNHGLFDFALTHAVVYYVNTEAELEIFFKNIFDFLKPGGKLFLGQNPTIASTVTDQQTLEDLCGHSVHLLKPDEDRDHLIFGPTESFAFYPASRSESETGRPFTREPMFSWTDVNHWSAEKLMEVMEKVGFCNTKLIPLVSFPDGISEDEQRRLKALELPFILIGAEKPLQK